MTNTTNYEFGDVVLVPFPFTNHAAQKKRPAIVISSTEYHSTRPDLILMPITSQIKVISYGELQMKNWQGAGLLKPSVVKPVITTIEMSLIIKLLGRLEAADQKSLKILISKLLG